MVRPKFSEDVRFSWWFYGDACSADSHCSEGRICHNHTCGLSQSGDRCKDNSSCMPGLHCGSLKICGTGEEMEYQPYGRCSNHDECPSDMFCRKNFCENRSGLGKACDVVHPCTLDLVCLGGFCRSICEKGSDCRYWATWTTCQFGVCHADHLNKSTVDGWWWHQNDTLYDVPDDPVSSTEMESEGFVNVGYILIATGILLFFFFLALDYLIRYVKQKPVSPLPSHLGRLDKPTQPPHGSSSQEMSSPVQQPSTVPSFPPHPSAHSPVQITPDPSIVPRSPPFVPSRDRSTVASPTGQYAAMTMLPHSPYMVDPMVHGLPPPPAYDIAVAQQASYAYGPGSHSSSVSPFDGSPSPSPSSSHYPPQEDTDVKRHY